MTSLKETPDYPGPGTGKITVTIPAGASLDMIGGILVDDGVIKSTKAWGQAVDSEERATSVQAGSYVMKKQMTAIDALRLLINPGGSRVRSQFTVPEGLRLSEQVNVLAKGTKVKKSAYQAALKKPKNLGLAQVREEEARRSSVPRDLRADGGGDGHLHAAADGQPVQVRDP